MNEEEYQLLREIKDNPEEGIRQAIDKYGPAVKTICRNILREYGDWAIEEAMQDSFVKLWKSIAEGKIIHDTLKGYVYSIARNASFDFIRSNRHNKNLPLEESDPFSELDEHHLLSQNPEDDFTRKQNEELLHDMINQLGEPERTIFILRYFYYFQVNEIAEKLMLKEDNVESKLRRGLKKLKDNLIERGVSYE